MEVNYSPHARLFSGIKLFFRRIVWTIIFMLMISSASATVNLQMRYSFNFKEASIKEVIKTISEAIDIEFFYSDSQVTNVAKKVTAQFNDMTLNEILSQSLKGTNLTYKLEDNAITIIMVKESGAVQQQTTGRDIKGKITDEKGTPLFGTTISIMGTQIGTSSEKDGTFSLQNVTSNHTLLVSMIGYERQLIRVGTKTVINIVLKEEITRLENVIATGYQTLPKERSTGSAQMIAREEIQRTPGTTLKDKLETLTLGFYFEPSYDQDQYPSEDRTRNIIIRGVSTFGNSNPLIVVDGFPLDTSISDPWRLINPDDVESVTILKDAAAASIWGSRAANGVIVINTIRSVDTDRETAPRIDISLDYMFQPVPNLNKIPWASSKDAIETYRWMIMEHDWLDNINNNPSQYEKYDFPEVIRLLLDMKAGKVNITDGNKRLEELSKIDVRDEFNDLFYNNVESTTKINIAFQTVTKNSSFQTSVTGTYWNRYAKGNDRNEINVQLSQNYRPKEWLELQLTGGIVHLKENQNGIVNNDLSNISQTSRILDENGNYLPMINSTYYAFNTQARRDTVNKYNLKYDWDWNLKREADNKNKYTQNTNTRANVMVVFKPLTGWRIEGAYGLQMNHELSHNYFNEESWLVRNWVNNYTQRDGSYAVPPGGMVNETKSYGSGYTFRLLSTYDATIGDRHQFRLLAGMERSKTVVESYPYGFFGYDPQSLTFVNRIDLMKVFTPPLETTMSGTNLYWQNQVQVIPGMDYYSLSARDDRSVSYYANAGYTLDGKYDLTGSIRQDKANLYGQGSKSNLPQWSVGLGWTISKESFIDRYEIIDLLRVYGSYGFNGNIRKDVSPYIYGYAWNDAVLQVPYFAVQSAPNPSLTWEKTGTYNIGINFALIQHIISGSLEVYRKKSKDVLVQGTVNGTYGFQNNRAEFNQGTIINSGFEAKINATIINNPDFSWRALFMYSTNRNIAQDFIGANPAIASYTNMSFYYRKAGQPTSYVAAIRWAGYDDEGIPKFMYGNREMSVKDVTSVATLDLDSTLVFIGQRDPKHFGTLRNLISYKGFELGITLYYKFGHLVQGDYPATNMRLSGNYFTPTRFYSWLPQMVIDRWRTSADADNAKMYSLESPLWTSSTHGQAHTMMDYLMRFGTQNIYDAGSIRLQNVSLSYVFNHNSLKSIGLSSLRVTINGNNLGPIFVKNKEGIDPDNVPYSSSTYGALMYVARNRPEFSLSLKVGF